MRAQRAAVYAADETAVESYGGADFKGGRLAARAAKYAQVAPHVQKQAEEAAHFQAQAEANARAAAEDAAHFRAQAEAHARAAAEEAIFAKSKNMPLHKRIDADGRVMGADGSAPRMSVSNTVPRSERFKQEMAERKVVYNELLRSQVAAKEKREQATAERGAPPPPSRHGKITTPPILQAMLSRGTGGGESLIVTPQNLKCYAKENTRVDAKVRWCAAARPVVSKGVTNAVQPPARTAEREAKLRPSVPLRPRGGSGVVDRPLAGAPCQPHSSVRWSRHQACRGVLRRTSLPHTRAP